MFRRLITNNYALHNVDERFCAFAASKEPAIDYKLYTQKLWTVGIH